MTDKPNSMRIASSGLRTLIVWVGIAAIGCAEPTDPTLRALEGTFVLQSVDGKPVPVLRLEYTYTREYLLTDTLWADGRGHYTRTTVTAIDSVARPYREIQARTRTGEYTIRGDTVDFAFSCPPLASCILPPIGWRLTDSEWVIAERGDPGFFFVSRFRRVE
jgi:hypothetical protein